MFQSFRALWSRCFDRSATRRETAPSTSEDASAFFGLGGAVAMVIVGTALAERSDQKAQAAPIRDHAVDLVMTFLPAIYEYEDDDAQTQRAVQAWVETVQAQARALEPHATVATTLRLLDLFAEHGYAVSEADAAHYRAGYRQMLEMSAVATTLRGW